MLEREAYLLQNQLNLFPIGGKLVLSDDGRLSFTLGALAKDASMGWLEKALGTDGLKERIAAGERPVVFDFPLAGHKVSWPVSLGGYGMKIEGEDRQWIVSLDYPSSGAVWQTISIIKARGTSKPWKQALAAGAG
jgi:hypothetical protein